MKRNILLFFLMLSIIYYLFNFLYPFILKDINNKKFLFFLIISIIILIIHFLKAIRFYFLTIDCKMSIKRFFLLYIKTTIISLVLPFKIGEFFRIYYYGKEMRNYKISMISVLLDRYFDTIPLLILLCISILISSKQFSWIIFLLSIFIVILTVCYLIFNSLYIYLNRFFIMNSFSRKGIKVLKVLKKLKQEKDYIQNALNNKIGLFLLISSISWILEYILLYYIAMTLKKFSLNVSTNYIISIFTGGDNFYSNIYRVISISYLIFIFFILCINKNTIEKSR